MPCIDAGLRSMLLTAYRLICRLNTQECTTARVSWCCNKHGAPRQERRGHPEHDPYINSQVTYPNRANRWSASSEKQRTCPVSKLLDGRAVVASDPDAKAAEPSPRTAVGPLRPRPSAFCEAHCCNLLPLASAGDGCRPAVLVCREPTQGGACVC